jgi:mono/diheme cytochrome c family protein
MKLAFLGVLLLASLAVLAQPAPATSDSSLGELLYSTHCGACHTTQVHWREKKLATDWASLKAQVTRWQANSRLGWSDGEISEVVRYLNGRYYHFPAPGKQVSLLAGR